MSSLGLPGENNTNCTLGMVYVRTADSPRLQESKRQFFLFYRFCQGLAFGAQLSSLKST